MADYTSMQQALAATPQESAGKHEALAEAILQELERQLKGPQPTMPQAPGFQPLDRMSAMAAATNPQAAGMLIQRAQQPSQDTYKAQVDAFNQAMENKRTVLATGMGIMGQQSREDIARQGLQQRQGQEDIMNQLRLLGLGIQQQNANTKSAATGKPGKKQLHDTPYGPMWFDPEDPNAPGEPAKGPDNKIIPPKPDAQVQGQLNSLDLADQVIRELRNEYDTVQGLTKSKVPGLQTAEQGALAGTMAVPGLRDVASHWGPAAAAARRHEASRRTLTLELQRPEVGGNRVLSQVLNYILEQIPSISASPDVAHPMYDKLTDLVAKTRGSLQALPSSWAYPGTSATPQQQNTDPLLEELWGK